MKKGFTLIEVIGAIVILGLISLIAIPTLLNVIKNKENEMNEVTKQFIFPKTIGNNYCVTIRDLVINNFLTEINTDDINLDTKIKVTIDDNKKYKYEIVGETCESTQLETEQLAISITNQDGVFNENNWAKEDFYVSIIGNGTGYKWCLTTESTECTPSAIENNSSGSAFIDIEGTNVVCAQATNGTNESEIECSNVFSLDKTQPTFEINSKPYFYGDNWENGWADDPEDYYNALVNGTLNDNLSGIDYYSWESSLGRQESSIFGATDNFFEFRLTISSSADIVPFTVYDQAGNETKIEITDFEPQNTDGNDSNEEYISGGDTYDEDFECPDGGDLIVWDQICICNCGGEYRCIYCDDGVKEYENRWYYECKYTN